MSKNYEKVKYFYTENLWPLNWAGDAVGKWITVDEYREITGKEFEEKE